MSVGFVSACVGLVSAQCRISVGLLLDIVCGLCQRRVGCELMDAFFFPRGSRRLARKRLLSAAKRSLRSTRTPTKPASAAESRLRQGPATKPASAANNRLSGRRGEPPKAAQSRWSVPMVRPAKAVKRRWSGRAAWPRVRSRDPPSLGYDAVSPPLNAAEARRPGSPGRAQCGRRSAWANAHPDLS